MARIRTVKPELFLDEQLAALPPLHRLAFIGLFTQADRAGRLEDRPRRLKMVLLPYDDVDMNEVLSDLHRAHFIIRYEANKQKLVQIRTFLKHQRPHHTEKESELPEYRPGIIRRKRRLSNGEGTDGMEGNGREGNGKEGSEEVQPLPATAPPLRNGSRETWDSYSKAYRELYGTEPVRNETVNSQIVKFLKRIPREEAPAVAAFYVHHRGAFYVKTGHPVGMLLKDAEKLHTEWVTNRPINATVAQRNERTEANSFARIAAEERRDR